MHEPNTLHTLVSYASDKGVKTTNEDAIGWHCADAQNLTQFSALACVADGVSHSLGGQQASELACTCFIEELINTPETWSVRQSVGSILNTINLRLYQQTQQYASDSQGHLCTFTAAIVQGAYLYICHVGDSRAYLYRDGQLSQLTRDHIAYNHKRTELTRALGMAPKLEIDCHKIELQEDDVVLLTTDGVHEFIAMPELQRLLAHTPFTELAPTLVKHALSADSSDNLSALALKINQLSDQAKHYAQHKTLPFPDTLEIGHVIDGYEIKEELFSSPRSSVYLVQDKHSKQLWAMKTPSVNFVDDTDYIARFIREQWIGQRIKSEHVVSVPPLNRPRSCLYYLMGYVQGETFDQWLACEPRSPKQIMAVIKDVAKGLNALHKMQTLHQDLKPANIMVDKQGRGKIVDFGSVFVAGLTKDSESTQQLGTATYGDPQYLLGVNPGEQGDIYALATIAYEAFTGELPYSSKVDDCKHFRDYERLHYTSACDYNPVIPFWFDKALRKGVALNLSERYQSVDELIKDLTTPNRHFFSAHPIVHEHQSKLRLWQCLCAFWFALTMAIVGYFIVS